MLWNGNECGGKNWVNENLKATIPSTDYDRSKTAGKCGIFKIFVLRDNERYKVHVWN